MNRKQLFRRVFGLALALLLTIQALPMSASAIYSNEEATQLFVQYGSFQAKANAEYEKNWDNIKQASKSQKSEPPKTDKEAVLQDIFNYGVNEGKGKFQKILMTCGYKLSYRAVKAFISPLMKSIKDSITMESLSGLNELEKLAKIRGGKQALTVLRGQKAFLYKAAFRSVYGLFGIIGLVDMCLNPKLGYNNAFFEFGANLVRGISIASSFLYPPLAVALAPTEFILTSSYFIRKVNEFETWSRDQHWLIDGAYGTANSIGEGINWIGEGLWYPAMFIWYQAGPMYRELETAVNVYTKKTIEEKLSNLIPVQKAVGGTCTANNINVYKPNIYLYPESPTAFTATFARPGLVTVSDPVYPRDGWRGVAEPDGILHLDGADYDFLFYESATDPGWYQTDEGFVIPAEARTETFTRILEAYGLNAREIADFNEFWCGKLEAGRDYAMYPQLTGTVDAAMPLTVTPAPDTVLRLWFAFAADETPATRATPRPLTREGFTLVEWGGFFLSR